MEIMVCVKQVPDDSVSIKLGADGQPELAGVTPVANAFDTYALEMATRFKEANGGSVTVVSAGDIAAVTPTLRSCLAVGADSAYCVNVTEGCMNSQLAAASKEIGNFDIILVGSESTDKSSMEAGARIANRAGLPLVCNVLAIEASDGGLTVKQETEDGYRIVEVPMPCVLTIVKPDYEPRYPSIKTKMAARKMPVNEVPPADVGPGCGCRKTDHVKYDAPPKREGGLKIEESDPQAAVAKALEMLAERKLV